MHSRVHSCPSSVTLEPCRMARNGLGVFLFYADSNALSLFPHPAVRRLPSKPIQTSSDMRRLHSCPLSFLWNGQVWLGLGMHYLPALSVSVPFRSPVYFLRWRPSSVRICPFHLANAGSAQRQITYLSEYGHYIRIFMDLKIARSNRSELKPSPGPV
jgi:hypothetical protein